MGPSAVILLALLATFIGSSCSGDPEARKREHLDRANQYYAEGELEAASIEYRNAIQVDPRFGEAHYRYGLCALDLNRWDVAAEALRNAVDLNPQNLDAKIKLAQVYLSSYRSTSVGREELLKLVKQSIEELASAGADPYETSRLAAQVALIEGRLDAAEENLGEAYRLRPDEADVVVALTQTLMRSGKGAQAESLAHGFLEKHKTFGPLYSVLYAHYFSRQNFAEAEAIAMEKVENIPDQIEPRLELAAHYARVKDAARMGETLNEVRTQPDLYPDWEIRLGDFYAQLGDWDEALRLYEQGAEKSASDGAIYHQRIGRVWMEKGEKQKAREFAELALAEDPDNREAKVLYALLLSASGEPEMLDAALGRWEELVSEQPANAAYLFFLGQTLRARGEVSAAKERFGESIKLNSRFAGARLALAEISLEAGEFRECANQAAEVLKLIPNHENALLLLAAASIRLGEHANAEGALNQYLKANPNNQKAEFQLARLHLARQDFSFAEEVYGEAYASGDGDLDAILGLADVYSAQKSYGKALSLLAKELERQPGSWALRAKFADTALRQGNMESAIEQYEYLAQTKPDVSELHLGLASARAKAGDLAGALSSAQRASELQPESASIQVLIGTLLDGQNKRAEAIPYYRQAVKLDPKNLIALNNLAFRLAESGDLPAALELARRASEQDRNNPIIADTLGWVYLKMGTHDWARRIFDELVLSHPGNPTYRYHRGAALLQQGEKAEARRELEAALARDPSNEERNEIRALLTQVE